MRVITLLAVLLLSACTTHVVEMTNGPTVQKYDLSDPEGDGVIEARDNCPNSTLGAQVDNNGCGTQSIEIIRRKLLVNFATDSYVIKAKYLPEIEKLAEFMEEFPQVVLIIEGHTSIRGSAMHNQVLSQNRADAIKRMLINEFGIADRRVTTVGYGFEKLLMKGNDEYTHARNRRIVAELSIDKSYVDMKWNIYSTEGEAE